MQRNAIGFTLIALFAIAVIGVAASSIHTTPIQSGFGIEGDSANGGNHNSPKNSSIDSNSGGGTGNRGDGGSGGGFQSQDTSSGSSGSIPPLPVLVVLVSVAAVGVALVVWATDNNDLHTNSMSATTETTEVENVTTDSSESVEPTNDVYRAWWEMVQQTEISHTASRSPAEFEIAATNAGMNPDAVAELTRLFRMIRYGNSSVTADAERRATAARDRLHSPSDTDEQEMSP